MIFYCATGIRLFSGQFSSDRNFQSGQKFYCLRQKMNRNLRKGRRKQFLMGGEGNRFLKKRETMHLANNAYDVASLLPTSLGGGLEAYLPSLPTGLYKVE